MLRYPAIKLKDGARVSPSGRAMWCGPFAVAVLTGLGYDEAHNACRKDARLVARARALVAADDEGYAHPDPTQGPENIDWTYPHQVQRVLTKLGVRCTLYDAPAGLTLQRMVDLHTKAGKTYLVHCGAHWLVVHDGMMYHSHHEPCPVAEAPRFRRAKVLLWYEVRPRPEALG